MINGVVSGKPDYHALLFDSSSGLNVILFWQQIYDRTNKSHALETEEYKTCHRDVTF